MSKKLLRPEQAGQWLARRYANQHRAWLAGGGDWPLRLPLGVPTERDFSDDTAGVRAWVDAWAQWQGAGELAWEDRRWPRIGTQRLPASLALASPGEVAAWAGQQQRWARATRRSAALQARWPRLAGGGLARQFDLLADYGDADFDRLVRAVDWFVAHPHSGLYLRQLPIEGIDTKWLERRTGAVTELLALLGSAEGGADFHEACGLRRLPHRIRLRLLCPALRSAVGGLGDFEAPVDELAALALRPQVLLIVENQQTGVALPAIDGVAAFVGLGGAVGALAGLPWLRGVPALYWGDIDSHGLAILARARRVLPGLRSVAMDEPTLLAHRALWSEEPAQHPDAELPELSAAERELFDGLRSNRWGPRVRLEQERLPWAPALAALRAAVAQLRGQV